ncbi:MAG: flagellar motor switch protein FliM, partial [Pirellula sp.]
MTDEVLSRNDVESLLKALDGGAAPASAAASASKTESKKPASKVRVLAYDFKRPERVGKEQMR